MSPACHLRGRPLEVHPHLVAAHGQLDRDPQRFRLVAEPVNEVLERVCPVGQGGELGTHQALAEQLQLVHVAAALERAVPLENLDQAALAGAAGRDLGPQVADHLDRLARVLLEDADHARVLAAGLVELEQGQPQPLLVDLGRVHGDRPRREPADVDVVRHRRGVPLELALVEDRLDHVEVRQVLAAEAVRIVGDEHVAGLDVLAEVLAHVPHDRRERPELDGEGQTLRDELALAVAERRRVVHRVADDGRVGAAHHDERHLVGHRRERVLDHLEGDGIDRDGGHGSRAMSMFPSASIVARQPGGMTHVASYSSTISGPSMGQARRARAPARRATRARARSRRGACARPASPPRGPASGSYGASPFAAARAVSFRLTMSIGASAEPWPYVRSVLGVEVRGDPAEVGRAGRDGQRQLVGLTGVADIGEA